MNGSNSHKYKRITRINLLTLLLYSSITIIVIIVIIIIINIRVYGSSPEWKKQNM